MARQCHEAAAALDAPQPPLPHQALALLPDSALSWGHRQMCKFTSIPPPWSGEQTCTSFTSSARQGCQLDKCGGHSSSRKPTDAALASRPLCPSAQRCRPLAAGPTGDPTQAVPRGTWRGWQAVYYPHSATPELRQGDCFLSHSCTHKMKTQFCRLIQTLIFQSIQRGKLHSWATVKGSMFRPTLGTVTEISVSFLTFFFPHKATEGAEGRAALSWEMRHGGILTPLTSPLCAGPQASETHSKTTLETVRALHTPSESELDILKARQSENKTEFTPLYHF